MLVDDSRYKTSKQIEAKEFSFRKDDRETTININEYGEVLVYSSISKHITKILKVAKTDNVKILTVNKNGTITSMKAILKPNQISFRNESKPKEVTEKES